MIFHAGFKERLPDFEKSLTLLDFMIMIPQEG
jgi:hypothetical protein